MMEKFEPMPAGIKITHLGKDTGGPMWGRLGTESVYIPTRVATVLRARNAPVDILVNAELVPNREDKRDATPWMAVWVNVPEVT